MAISPPSDIVLDVARAADPAALEAARARLMSIGGAKNAEAFSQAASSTARAEQVGRVATRTPEADSYVKFEAMVLQNFIEKMLPSQAESVYGTGIAGEMWKSFLAQQIGTQMAEAGGIGIAKQVLGDFYMAGEQRVAVQGVNGNPDEAENADRQSLLSAAMVEEIQRAIVRGVADTASTATGVTAGE
ncbi:rod-binding protein [Aquibium sp. LZ166]|uniref:Rod-binding protein n=1 Tax=Aquibium pacificus TaxID=3153579 RepID=A0ABV3SBP6_9HYPH